jgi:hypothetical protein
MPRHHRQPPARQLPVHDVQIGAADRAGADLEQQLAGARNGHGQRFLAQALMRGVKAHTAHQIPCRVVGAIIIVFQFS